MIGPLCRALVRPRGAGNESVSEEKGGRYEEWMCCGKYNGVACGKVGFINVYVN